MDTGQPVFEFISDHPKIEAEALRIAKQCVERKSASTTAPDMEVVDIDSAFDQGNGSVIIDCDTPPLNSPEFIPSAIGLMENSSCEIFNS